MKICDARVGDFIIQRRAGKPEIKCRIAQISEGPNGSLRILLEHPDLHAIGASGQKAAFWPADKRQEELPDGLLVRGTL